MSNARNVGAEQTVRFATRDRLDVEFADRNGVHRNRVPVKLPGSLRPGRRHADAVGAVALRVPRNFTIDGGLQQGALGAGVH
jgi:hypothetical protein